MGHWEACRRQVFYNLLVSAEFFLLAYVFLGDKSEVVGIIYSESLYLWIPRLLVQVMHAGVDTPREIQHQSVFERQLDHFQQFHDKLVVYSAPQC